MYNKLLSYVIGAIVAVALFSMVILMVSVISGLTMEMAVVVSCVVLFGAALAYTTGLCIAKSLVQDEDVKQVNGRVK